VVHCDAAGTVVRIDRMPPGRLGRPCPRGRWVVEAPAGSAGREPVGAPPGRLE